MQVVGEYHKIMGPFKRHVDGPNKNKLIFSQWTCEEFAFLQNVPWRWTEKVDGTNVRVVWDGHKPTFLGRTDRAQMPTKLLAVLQEQFTEEILEQVFGSSPVTLFGEGYGAGIQKGGNYRQDQAFILFDVNIHGIWLEYPNTAAIADSLGIDVVPVYSMDTLREQIRDMATRPFYSVVAEKRDTAMEGLVGTPLVPLRDRRGGRVIVKLKTEDIYGMALTRHIKTVSLSLPLAA